MTFAASAPAAFTNAEWSVHVWQTDEGLPNNNVTSLAQTGDGYLWVATFGHLARFDGAHFEEFTSKDVIPDYAGYRARFSALLVDSRDNLWLAMVHGLVVRLHGGKAEAFTNNLPDFIAQNMLEDGDGAIWITYHGSVVCRIADHRVTRMTTKDGLPPRFDCALARDNRGRIWFAKEGQVGRFENGHFVSLNNSLERNARLAAAREGGVWICSGRGLFKCDDKGTSRSVGVFPPGLGPTDPTCLLEDKSGAVWVGTAAGGLFRYDGLSFESIPTSHPYITSLLEDREGDLWVGTGGGGLDRIQPRAFTMENEATGLPLGKVQSVCEDQFGAIWAVTQNGQLFCRTNGVWHVVSSDADWPGGRAACVTASRDGAVWIGTQSHVLVCRRGGHFTAQRVSDGFPGHVVLGLLSETNGDLWIVEEDPNVVQCLHGGKFETFQLPRGSGVPRALCEDAAKDIWIGTSKGLLLRVHNGMLSDETARMSGGTASIRTLAATPDGSLWIGYASWGLGRFKDGRYARITSAQGLFNDYISEIVPDGRGSLWFGCDRGIFKVRRNELDDVAEGRAARVLSIHYGEGNGLRSLQASFGVSPNVWRTAEDRLWFSTLTGLAVVNLNNEEEDLRPPPTLLKQVLVDDQVIAAYGGAMPVRPGTQLLAPGTVLRLPPEHRRVEFDFTALCFSEPENVHLQYRLTDFEDRWVDSGVQRSISYARLPAGTYQFQLRAQTGDGPWSEVRDVNLLVRPFFWQTWWFGSVMLAMFTGAVIAIVRYVSFRRLRSKVRALEQQAALDKERSRIAKDIHDELGGSLTQIKLLFELTHRNRTAPERVSGLGQEGLAATRQIIKSMDEIVWAVNPRNDSLPNLIDYLGQFAIEFLARADIRCRVDLPEHPGEWTVTPEVRHNLFLAVKETLNNIVRHADASEVWLRVKVAEKDLTITMEDNGHGFEPKGADEFADGLPNIRQRMTEIGGHARIESGAGQGTRVSLFFPMQKANEN